MANLIQIKRSSTPGNVPASLLDGELAINEVDEVLFYKNAAGQIRKMALPSASMDALAAAGLQINGSMELDQEHSGAAVSLSNGGQKYIVDQWEAVFNHTANTAVFSANQSVLNAAATLGNNLGFGLRMISSTALVSPNIGDYVQLIQPIEGYRWESMNYGLAIAHTVTIGFWVFTTATGTASVSIRNSSATSPNRSYVTNFTVTAANTWQFVTVTIPGDKAGTWLNGNNIGAYVTFCFACGSTFQTTANTWTAGNFLATSANTNFFATNGNQAIITGVVILPGSNMPPVARFGLLLRPYSQELSVCQRYYWTSVGSGGQGIPNCLSSTFTQAYFSCSYLFPVKMRTSPTMSIVGSFLLLNCGYPVIWVNSPDGFTVYAVSTGAFDVFFYPNATNAGAIADARM
jgi:hypothetical protein